MSEKTFTITEKELNTIQNYAIKFDSLTLFNTVQGVINRNQAPPLKETIPAEGADNGVNK